LFQYANVQSITTPWDVSIASGDIFNGIHLIFPGRHLDHDPVLTIQVSGANLSQAVATQDIYLSHDGGSVPVAPFVSTSDLPGCPGSYPTWYPPAEVDVDVDQEESFCFRAAVATSFDVTTGYVEVVDPLGWVPDGFEQEVPAGCAVARCIFNYVAVTVPVHVPAGVLDGTTNEITLRAYAFGILEKETTVTLHAVNPIHTSPTTWGRVKTLYR
jgi:hypothetical protein